MSSLSTTTSKNKPIHGAILPNGKVNVSLIQREITNDLSADARYHAEDGMKKRAVHMSKDYDEFKIFVACSQQKSVPSSEMGQLFTQRESSSSAFATKKKNLSLQTQNKACTQKSLSDVLGGLDIIDIPSKTSRVSSRRKSHTKSTRNSNTKSSNIPQNSMELEREWRHHCQTPYDTLHYLMLPYCDVNSIPTTNKLRIIPEDISQKICRIEMDSSILEDIISALHYLLYSCKTSDHHVVVVNDDDKDTKNDQEHESEFRFISENKGHCISITREESTLFVYRWMRSLSQCGRFSLNVSFLGDVQKEYVRFIFDRLQEQSIGMCKEEKEEAVDESNSFSSMQNNKNGLYVLTPKNLSQLSSFYEKVMM